MKDGPPTKIQQSHSGCWMRSNCRPLRIIKDVMIPILLRVTSPGRGATGSGMVGTARVPGNIGNESLKPGCRHRRSPRMARSFKYFHHSTLRQGEDEAGGLPLHLRSSSEGGSGTDLVSSTVFGASPNGMMTEIGLSDVERELVVFFMSPDNQLILLASFQDSVQVLGVLRSRPKAWMLIQLDPSRFKQKAVDLSRALGEVGRMEPHDSVLDICNYGIRRVCKAVRFHHARRSRIGPLPSRG
jgi:hypothetical protein